MKIKLLFAWFDFWIGLFYDKKKNWLYILPIPMCGIILKFPERRYWLVSTYEPHYIIGSCEYTKKELQDCMKQDKCFGAVYWARNGETEPLFHTDFSKGYYEK